MIKPDKLLINSGIAQLGDDASEETLEHLVSVCRMALLVGVSITWSDWCEMSELTQAALAQAAMLNRGEEDGEAQALRQMGMMNGGAGGH